LAFAYWAFFSCIVIAVCSVIAFFRHRTAKAFGLALLYIVIISITAVVAMTGSLLYWHQHGLNTAMHYKSPSEADTYGLSVRQMLTPIIEHPLPALAAIRRKIASANFPSDATESQMASLGSIGSLGFLLLTLIAVARPSRGILSDTRLAQLAGLSIALVLVAEIGGFGSLFNALILHEFRCYNRISPFISLFSFAAIAIVLDDLLRQRQGVIRYGIFISIVLAGLFDQIPVALFRSHRAEERRFYDDRYFIQELERRLPANAMIFQLPHTGFPMDAGQNKMAPYDNARAYLHSHNLRWPWGAMDGRNGDWSKTVASLPMKQFLEQIESAGFEGILLDRYGYPDSRLERQAVAELGASNRFDRGGRWVFFDLRASRNNLTASLTPAERTKRQDIARYPIGVIWLPAFSVEERNADQTWHWCGRTGIIRLVNDSDIHREVEIDALLQNGSRGPDVLRIDRQGRILNFDLGQDLTPYHDRIALEAHQLVQVSFSFSGPLLAVPGDSRELAFRVVDFRLKEVTQ
jgi:phosphoglycerol transferase